MGSYYFLLSKRPTAMQATSHSTVLDWQPLLTLVVAISALCVTWAYNRSQVRIGEAKLKLDLFERRLVIYQKVTDYMDSQFKAESIGVDATPFFKSISAAKWLFDESVQKWVYDELMPAVRRMWTAHYEQDAASPGPEKARLMLVEVDVKVEFWKQYERRDKVFGPFLKQHEERRWWKQCLLRFKTHA